jgi:predicted small secreted protein
MVTRARPPALLLLLVAALSLAACASGSGAGVDVAAGGATDAGAEVSAVTPNQMTVEWEPEVRGDRTRITGYVYNGWVLPARDIVLLVEGLDQSGQPVARTFGRVDRVLTPGTRSYFEVGLPRPAATYRVRVASVRWLTDDDRFSRWWR